MKKIKKIEEQHQATSDVATLGLLMFALSFPGFDFESTFTCLSRLHARVMSFCQSSVVRLHGYSKYVHGVGTFLLFVVVCCV